MKTNLFKEFVAASNGVLNKYKIPLLFLLFIIICFNFSANILNVIYSPFDADEWQHLHIAWDVFNGKIIYKDFIEHHGCIYPFLNSAIFSIFSLKPDLLTISIIRDTNLIYSFFILFLTYKIAKEISGDIIISVLSVALLSCLIFYQDTTTQIRPDGLQNVFWLIGVLLILKNINFDKYILSFLGGLFLSLSVLTNPKALIEPAAVILYFILIYYYDKADKKLIAKNFIVFLSGFVVPYLIVSTYFILHNALGAFFFYNYEFNVMAVLKYNSRHVKEYMKFFWKNETLFYLLAISGTLYFLIYFIKNKNNIILNKKYLLLLITTLITSLGALTGLYSQYFLIFLPLLSIVTSLFIVFIFNHSEKKGLIYKIAFISVVSILFIQLANSKINNTYTSYSPVNIQQMELVNYILKKTNRSEPVLFIWCRWGGYVFNSDLQFFWFENENFRNYYKEIAGYDVFGNSLITKLKTRNVRYVIGSRKRISLVLNENAYNYFVRNYKQSNEFKDLWIKFN